MIIPLAGAAFPSSAEELRKQLDEAGTELRLKVRSEVEAANWPAIESLEIDVTGSEVDDASRFARPGRSSEGSMQVQRFALKGKPISVQHMPLSLEVKGTDTLWNLARRPGGAPALVLERAGDGDIDVRVSRSDVEQLAQTLLSTQAGKHGVNITETRLSFVSRGPRSLSLRADVTAKMMLIKATLTVTGDLDLDDALQLRISNLELTGGGMVAGLARGFLQPHFDRLQARPIALAALEFGEVRLRDVSLAVAGEELQLHAKFGS